MTGPGPRPRPTTAAIAAHDDEHAWRSAGEWAIRQEMERRIDAWLKKPGTQREARAA